MQSSSDCDFAVVIGSTLTYLIRSRSNIVLVVLTLSGIVSVKLFALLGERPGNLCDLKSSV